MEITIDQSNWTAISFENASTLYLADGSTNKIRIDSSRSGSYIYAIYAYQSLKIKGSGSLEIEFAETTRQNNEGYTYRAISADGDLTFEHTGNVTVTVEKIDVTTTLSNGLSQFNVCESLNAGVFYKSGNLFLNAGMHYCKAGDGVAGEPADYIMFHTPKGNVTLQMTPETGGSIGWNSSDDLYLYSIYFYKGKTAPSGADSSGLLLLGGYSPESLTEADTIDDLNGKDSAKVWYPPHAHTFEYEITKQPTATETGTAEGFCSDGDGASDTRTLPALTDAAYAKVSHAATTEADAYDEYTYSEGGVTLTFQVVHENTKLPQGGGDNDGGNGGDNGNNGGTTGGNDNNGLSGGAIAGIAIGSTVGVLLIVYILGYFLFFAKGKLAGKFFAAIYRPMNKLFRK